MKNRLWKTLSFIFFVSVPILSLRANDPTIRKENGITRLIVDDKPFIMLSGELHNSTSSTMEYLEPMMMTMKAMNLNSVIASISWEQFEPKEGTYDYTMIDGIIDQAEKQNLKVCVIWFAT
ncbi:MAG: beta-galactosidase [Bacteroidales bacterium]|nr:beta-galactosidase [Bacteroidales bacterium]MDD4823367.1 beta-galactosidase [Bacteroidales bacterium]